MGTLGSSEMLLPVELPENQSVISWGLSLGGLVVLKQPQKIREPVGCKVNQLIVSGSLLGRLNAEPGCRYRWNL